ncbi:hypothetical protein QCA50_001356 [Cerrena zonata]|uniref:Uncharacterized protein n=1 Tax=Cerrena zonata TaxID=2478898 RepID=A0AAW0GL57_9APHY
MISRYHITILLCHSPPLLLVLYNSPVFLITSAGGLVAIMALSRYEAGLLHALNSEEAKAIAQLSIQQDINNVRNCIIGVISIYLAQLSYNSLEGLSISNMVIPSPRNNTLNAASDLEANLGSQGSAAASSSRNVSSGLSQETRDAIHRVAVNLQSLDVVMTNLSTRETRTDRHSGDGTVPSPYTEASSKSQDQNQK